MILAGIVKFFKPKRVIEFGAAEGRTTLNFALHVPPDGEVVTWDFPPMPGTNDVGFFHWEQPRSSKINQIFQSVHTWDSTPYQGSAEIVFCDACDHPEDLSAETAQAFRVVKLGGVIFRHDYTNVEGPTIFWNSIAKELPICQPEGTTLVCLWVKDQVVYDKMREMAASGRIVIS